MPPEPPSSSPPTAEQIEQQIRKLRKDPLMQGELRCHALRWLIEFQRSGKYDRKRYKQLTGKELTAKAIFFEFYKYAQESPGIDLPNIPKDTEASGKKLFGELADALEEYYARPGASDSIIIMLQRGHGGLYEPQIELRPAPSIISFASYPEPGDRDNAVISDTRLISGIEAKVPDGTTDIWVAAPDLSNVGDETSPFSELVRKTVRDNARRGVSYTYVCPKGHAGHSRIQNLIDCFIGTSGKLHLHQVPPERFCEITLVQAHFISFNPRDEMPDAYMQLPLCQASKGWIKLSRKDAARVLAKMKCIIAEFPAEKTGTEEPAAP